MSQLRHDRGLRYGVVDNVVVPLRRPEDGWRREERRVEFGRGNLQIVREIGDWRERRLWQLLIDGVVGHLRLQVRGLSCDIVTGTVT